MLPGIFVALAMQPDPAMLRRLFEEALARREKQYGMSDAHTAQAARDLGMFLARQNDAQGARTALAEAVRIDEAAFGSGGPQTLSDVAELAAVEPSAEAEPLWRRAAESKDPRIAARALEALGALHAAGGDRAGAAELYRRALPKEEAAAGKESVTVAVCLNALAQLVDVKDGIPMLTRALEIDRRVLGVRHPETATTEANLAGLLVNADRNDEAIHAATDALSIFQETLGPDHPRCAVTASMLAYALDATGRRALAEKMYRMALAIDERAYGPGHPQTQADARALAEFLRRVGKAR
jgi:tetratricopeptide (TPR) repeat protein